jgi:hypothetical protein
MKPLKLTDLGKRVFGNRLLGGLEKLPPPKGVPRDLTKSERRRRKRKRKIAAASRRKNRKR